MIISLSGFSQISYEDSTAIEFDGEIIEISGSACDPAYPGGDMAMMKFISDSIRYPAEAVDMSIQGVVYVQFIVDTTGQMTEVKAVHGPEMLRKSAVDVISKMPRWEPAYCFDKYYNVRYTLPITYSLH